MLARHGFSNSGIGYAEMVNVLSWHVFALMIERMTCRQTADTKHRTRFTNCRLRRLTHVHEGCQVWAAQLQRPFPGQKGTYQCSQAAVKQLNRDFLTAIYVEVKHAGVLVPQTSKKCQSSYQRHACVTTRHYLQIRYTSYVLIAMWPCLLTSIRVDKRTRSATGSMTVLMHTRQGGTERALQAFGPIRVQGGVYFATAPYRPHVFFKSGQTISSRRLVSHAQGADAAEHCDHLTLTNVAHCT